MQSIISVFISRIFSYSVEKDSNRQTKRYKSYSKRIGITQRFATSFAIVFVLTFLASCSTQKEKIHFTSSDDAVKQYRMLLSNIKEEKTISADSLSLQLVQWKEMSDSVLAYLNNDTIKRCHYYPISDYNQIRDSIKMELLRLAVSRQRTYSDVLSCKLSNSIASFIDDDVKRISEQSESFFASLDTITLQKSSCKNILKTYKDFLNKTEASGIHSKQQLLAFITKEDILFRSFLLHINDVEKYSVADITKKTEQVCLQIIECAKNKEISSTELMVYLNRRTNRRMLKNAWACIEQLKRNQSIDADTRKAYFWMILQPYMSIDNFAMSVLTKGQQEEFKKLARQTPKVIEGLSNDLNMDKSSIQNLPNLFLKLYIINL